MSQGNMKLCLIIGGIALLALVVYLVFASRKGNAKGSKSSKEGFTYAAGNIGSLDSLGQYERVEAPDFNLPGEHWADRVQGGDLSQVVSQPQTTKGMAPRPLERLVRTEGESLMPRTSKNVTPYNIDVQDKNSYVFLASQPRVQLKNPRWENSLFMAIVGDAPIRYHPNVALIGHSRYGRDSWQGWGVFSPYYKALYNRYTGKERLNMPQYVSNQELVMDYGPDS